MSHGRIQDRGKGKRGIGPLKTAKEMGPRKGQLVVSIRPRSSLEHRITSKVVNTYFMFFSFFL